MLFQPHSLLFSLFFHQLQSQPHLSKLVECSLFYLSILKDLYNYGCTGSLFGEGNGNPLQYSCLENPMDGGAWCRLLSWGRIAVQAFSSCSRQGLLSRRGVQASHCGGFSCCGAGAGRFLTTEPPGKPSRHVL